MQSAGYSHFPSFLEFFDVECPVFRFLWTCTDFCAVVDESIEFDLDCLEEEEGRDGSEIVVVTVVVTVVVMVVVVIVVCGRGRRFIEASFR
jgi:hypothetical protein